jgi:hypothetical protein
MTQIKRKLKITGAKRRPAIGLGIKYLQKERRSKRREDPKKNYSLPENNCQIRGASWTPKGGSGV